MLKYRHDRRKDPALAPEVYESPLIDVNKEVHHCVVHVQMIPGTQNSVASLVDITDRKTSGEALEESEEKFRVMAENSPVAIVVYQENRIIYVNDYTAAISGTARKSSTGWISGTSSLPTAGTRSANAGLPGSGARMYRAGTR